jgi:hypothetical protein
MVDIIKYRGCAIALHAGLTNVGRIQGSYEITAETEGAMKAFERHAITRMHTLTIIETSDTRETNPTMLDANHLREMAQREVDHIMDKA